MERDSVFDKVLFVGPQMRQPGGIASLLCQYSHAIRPFHYLPTNHRRGTLAGLFVLAATVLRLPFERLKGRRIAHLHYSVSKSWPRKAFLCAYAKALGFKVVMHCHAGAIIDFSRRRGADSVRRVLRRADCNIVLAEVFRTFFEETLRLDNVRIVNNIIAAPPVNAPKTLVGDEPLKLLFLGDISEAKGVFDLLQALKTASEKTERALKLYIGGKGAAGRLLDQIEALGLADSVEYLGEVGPEQKQSLLAQCHAMVLPSYVEAQPMSLLEGLASGLTLISTNVGGIPEIVGDGGFLVAPGDTGALAEAIARCASDPGTIASDYAGNVRRAQNYRAEDVVKSLEKIYAELLSDNR